MQIKQSTSYRIPILLVDSSGTPLTGKIYSDIVLYLQKAGGAPALRTLSSGELVELRDGSYEILLGTADTNTLGQLRYWASCTGSVVCESLTDYEVTTNSINDAATYGDVSGIVGTARDSIKGAGQIDTSQIYSRIGAPSGASLAADVANVSSQAARSLALVGENTYIRSLTYDVLGNALTGIREAYDTAQHAALHDGVTGLVASWAFTATYNATQLAAYKQERTT